SFISRSQHCNLVYLYSFPTRRSSDLHTENPNIAGLWVNSPFYDFNMGFLAKKIGIPIISGLGKHYPDTKIGGGFSPFYGESLHKDRKSTRLNSSHVKISYAVFCLKKK